MIGINGRIRDSEAFGRIVKTALTSQGATMATLARSTHTTSGSISQQLSGKHSPTLKSILAILDELGLELYVVDGANKEGM